MIQFKFSCPGCGQHFSGNFGYCGLQMTCPACQNQFTAPTPGTPAPVASASSVRPRRTTIALPAKIPVAPPRREPPAPGPVRTSGLALASLICSAGSFILIPFGFIPGIICGHMARRRLAQSPGLRGRGLAKAGLILGYTAIGLYIVVVLVFLARGMSL
jgi:hypothetical protein